MVPTRAYNYAVTKTMTIYFLLKKSLNVETIIEIHRI